MKATLMAALPALDPLETSRMRLEIEMTGAEANALHEELSHTEPGEVVFRLIYRVAVALDVAAHPEKAKPRPAAPQADA